MTPNSLFHQASKVRAFYENAHILVTGGTGFLGKILIEKLLRGTNPGAVYVLIRNKKGTDPEKRLDELFENRAFQRLRQEKPWARTKLTCISGDCSLPNLGLNQSDIEVLTSKVNVVFHSAATVKFDEELKLAFNINVNGTKRVLSLCNDMTNLKSMVYISTAYSNCNLNKIDEVFYDHPMSYEEVEQFVSVRNPVNGKETHILRDWPNTYTFTKAIAEDVVKEKSRNLPVAVVRPGIVTSSYKEPEPGWVDTFYGPNQICAAMLSGLLRTALFDGKASSNVVPVDTCANAIIAAAWDTSLRTPNENVVIYNFVSSAENPLTWDEYRKFCMAGSRKYPYSKVLGRPSSFMTTNKPVYEVTKVFMHWIPGFCVDLYLLLTGRQPKVLRTYRQMHYYQKTVKYFTLRNWIYSNGNTQQLWNKMNEADRHIFPMSMVKVHWPKYMDSYVYGIRKFLLKNDENKQVK